MIPDTAKKIIHVIVVTDTEGVPMLADRRVFENFTGEATVWTSQRQIDEIQSMMSRYLEDVNAMFPVTAGYTIDASCSYMDSHTDEDWPPSE